MIDKKCARELDCVIGQGDDDNMEDGQFNDQTAVDTL